MNPFRDAVFTALLSLGLASAAAAQTTTIPRPSAPPRTPVVYGAAAADRTIGPIGTNPFEAILPSGRLVRPFGYNAIVGMNAWGLALSPDGRYAIVSNDDERQAGTRSLYAPGIVGGFSLTVVDTTTMRVTSQYTNEDEKFFAGVVALRDPADPSRTLVLASGGPTNTVYAFTLDASGTLAPDARHLIAVPGPIDPAFADENHAFPATIAVSADGRRAYVVNNLGGSVSAIDTASRTLLSTRPVGFFPYGAAVAGNDVLVTNEGLMRYANLPQPVRVPPFSAPPSDPAHASSLAFVGLGADGDLAAAPAGALTARSVPMDPTPDGLRVVGGAHPTAIAVTPNARYAFVAMTNVDRIATVALGAAPRVVGGTELRFFDRGPYGTQPTALALSADGTRLYAALAGIDAVAVIDTHDPVHPHRLGLIPTGWYPTALALSPNGQSLYVTNAKGFGHERGFTGAKPELQNGRAVFYGQDANVVWSTLERIDLARVNLRATTPTALAAVRRAIPAPSGIVPQAFVAGASRQIRHVVLLLEENKTFDSMLGDLTDVTGRPYGGGDPQLTTFGATVTPNLHALAREFGLATNFYSDAEESDAGHQFVAGGIASAFTEKTLLVKSGRRPLVNKNEDVEDYPRDGYIFNALARHGLTARDYGDLVRVNGYDEGQDANPRRDDPNFVNVADRNAPTSGLGGLYYLDAPAPRVLGDRVDLNYPGWNLRIRDERRAREFISDYDRLLKIGNAPAFTYVWLPADHGGVGQDIPPVPEEVADGDRALGMIVDYLSHSTIWGSTAAFILPDDSQSSRDHVDTYHSYAIVVSPFAKRHYLGRHHLSTVSVLKTEEELFGLPPLALGDLLATDMSDFFTTTPNRAPFSALAVPTQTASREGTRIAALLAQTDQSHADADSARQGRLIDLSRQADLLAAKRGQIAPATYARLQGELFAAAVRTVRTTSEGEDD